MGAQRFALRLKWGIAHKTLLKSLFEVSLDRQGQKAYAFDHLHQESAELC